MDHGRGRRWLASVPLSLALHAAIVVAAVTLLRLEQAPSGLVIDLSAIVAEADRGPGGGASPPSSPAPRSANGGATPARPAPTPLPHRADPPKAESRDVAPMPSIVVANPSPTATPPALTSTESTMSPAVATEPGTSRPAEQGAADGAPVGRGDTTWDQSVAAGASGARGGSGIGAAGDRLAALGPGDGRGPGSDYTVYLARLRQRIQESLRYPSVARRRGVTGTVQLEISIEPDGAIGAVSVIASSSHELLDRAAADAARSLPRAPFPADVRPRALKVRLPVVFELQ